MLRVKQFLSFFAVLMCSSGLVFSQGVTRYNYHDPEKRHVKEVYQVRDTINNILEGKYASYFLNGSLESKGQFANNETSGTWEFYYETGQLKMKGVLLQNSNFGVWEYFYENGKKSMEGIINGRMREGVWKTYFENGQLKEEGEYLNNNRVGLWKNYFEDGNLRGSIEYKDNYGIYSEYYHSGQPLGVGPKNGRKQVGHWKYFAEDGSLESEGDYREGSKHGDWIYYYATGEISAKGTFRNDKAEGQWNYYYEDGQLKSVGEFKEGNRSGYWKSTDRKGGLQSEITYDGLKGTYHEYYPDGKLKVTGNMVNDLREGRWEFFTQEGTLEGECSYIQGKGTYQGYYPDGTLQTKGEMENEKKVGVWELYETDGVLSGYYRPFYDDKKIGKINSQEGTSSIDKVVVRGKHFNYFDQRFNEFKGVIVGTNPLFVALGTIPVGVEFYLQGRLGHEFEFVGIRDPFFKSDMDISPGQLFERGYSIAIKQKFYNPFKAGMWYFGHEIRFTNKGHFTNVSFPSLPEFIFMASAIEQKIEYGLVLGYRLMKRSDAGGLTIDIFGSFDIGYRAVNVEGQYEMYFTDLNRSNFSKSFNFGLNFGNIFPYR